MYLIPKNIKVKKEIFKGFGIIEIITITMAIGLGYLISMIANSFQMQAVLFCIIPLATFILLIPLPIGGNAFNILAKFLRFINSQKKYKKYV